MTVTDFFAAEIVTELLKQLCTFTRKTYMVRSNAKNLHASLSKLLPTINEIKYSGVELPEPRQCELDRFSETLRDGLELTQAALHSNRLNIYKNVQLRRKMEKVESAVLHFFQVFIQGHILADVHHLRVNQDVRFDRLDRQCQSIDVSLERLESLSIGGGGDRRPWAEEVEMEVVMEESVGMEFGRRKVKEMVIGRGRDDLRVVGVLGIAGSGKTTLVQELCRDADVVSYFGGRILFLPVSQSPDFELLSRKIWGFHMGNNDLRPNYVIPQYNFNHPMEQSVRRLVVLDDVWSLPDLEKLLPRFQGCKTIVTSRIKFPTVIKDNATHEMALLREDEALALFCMSAFGQKSVPPMIDGNLVNQIVNECKGLPLALKVVGRALNGETEKYWISARKRLARGEIICESHECQLLDRMAMSVNMLSEKVRECFLDFGAFPEDKKVPLDVLINMWEVLHHIDADESFAILNELTSKNLLTLVKDSRYGDKYCSNYDIVVTQHDVLRDLALLLSSRQSERVNERVRLFMPKRESGLPEEWKQNLRFNARIVSIHTGDMQEMDWFPMDFPEAEVLILNFSSEAFVLPHFMENMPKLKAVVIINHHPTNATLGNFPEFSTLSNLRSLWLEKVTVPQLSKASAPLTKFHKLSLVLCKVNNCFDPSVQDLSLIFPNLSELIYDHCDDLFELPPSVCTMHKLENLSITNCHNFRNLPPNLGQAKMLQILRLYACPELKELPNSLTELFCLMYLDISQCVKLSRLPPGMDRLGKMEKIDMRDCPMFTRLPKFGAPSWSLRFVVCDDELSCFWQDAKRLSLPNLTVEVAEKYYSLDWLDE